MSSRIIAETTPAKSAEVSVFRFEQLYLPSKQLGFAVEAARFWKWGMVLLRFYLISPTVTGKSGPSVGLMESSTIC
jgi:hypothetical protein